MRFELADDAGVGLALIDGDVDFGSADDLSRDILRWLPDTALGLVLDLSNVRYVDSGGVRIFFELASRLEVSGRKVALAVPENSPLRRLIKITRLEEAVFLCPSAQECTEMIRQA